MLCVCEVVFYDQKPQILEDKMMGGWEDGKKTKVILRNFPFSERTRERHLFTNCKTASFFCSLCTYCTYGSQRSQLIMHCLQKLQVWHCAHCVDFVYFMFGSEVWQDMELTTVALATRFSISKGNMMWHTPFVSLPVVCHILWSYDLMTQVKSFCSQASRRCLFRFKRWFRTLSRFTFFECHRVTQTFPSVTLSSQLFTLSKKI